MAEDVGYAKGKSGNSLIVKVVLVKRNRNTLKVAIG